MQHKQAINKAEFILETELSSLKPDYHRPHYHASPKMNWMNAPTGFIYYNNAYHLFYQHNPYNVEMGNIHWAHTKSSNLIDWEHLPIALAPSKSYDRDSCFSGNVIEHKGNLYVFYTANIFTSEMNTPDDLLQQQCMAISVDGGMTFVKFANNPIISAPPPQTGENNHFRNPKVWSHNGKWYMVLGTKQEGRGKVLLYRSTNLHEWTFISVLIESNSNTEHLFECLDFFSLNGQDILLFSSGDVQDYPVSGYYVGKLNYETGQYEHGSFQLLDYGYQFNAPQTLVDGSGRRILIGSLSMKGSQLNKQWSGSMTAPRELILNGNKLYMKPVKELLELKDKQLELQNLTLKQEQHKMFTSRSATIEALFDLTTCTAEEFGLTFFTSNNEYAKVGYDISNHSVYIDYSHITNSPYPRKYCKLNEAPNDKLKILLLIDNCTVEVFINDGQYVLSSLIFPSEESNGISLYAQDGSVVVERLDIWS